MKTKNLYPTFAIAAVISVSLSIAPIYSQPLWHAQHLVSPITHRSPSPAASNAVPSTEYLTVISRDSTADTSTLTSTTQSYNANGVLAGSTPLKTISTTDNLTGHTLVTYHGASNQDKTSIRYDALGRQHLVSQTEQDLQKQWHTEGQQTQYHLAAGDTYVTVTHFADSHLQTLDSSKLLTSQTTHLDGMGREIYATDSRHGSQLISQVSYNDLGQAAVKTDLLGNTQVMQYDALGESVQTVKTIHHPATKQAKGFTQTVITANTIDHVANTKASQQQAIIKIGSSSNWQAPTQLSCDTSHTNNPNNQCTGKTITQLDDQGQVTEQVSQGSQSSPTNNNTPAQAFVTQHQYDNFGDKQQDTLTLSHNPTAITPLITQFTFDAMGNMAHATTQKRNSNEQDIDVDFNNNLQGTLISKTVNGKTPYRYVYDAAGNILEEIRYDTKANDGSYINQHYFYSDNGYTVKRTAWSANGTKGDIVETDSYIDVDGKKTLQSQWTPDATIDSDYDYNVGKPSSIQQTPTSDAAAKTDPKNTITYQYDDISGHLLNQWNSNGQTIHYHYYLTNNKAMPDGLESRTVFVKNANATGIKTHYAAMQAIDNNVVGTITQIDQVKIGTTITNDPKQKQHLVTLTTLTDAQGNVTQERRTNVKGIIIENKQIDYDSYSRPKEIRFTMSNSNATEYIDYSYRQGDNNTRQLSSQTEYGKNGQSDDKIVTTYTYDNGNRLAHVSRTDTDYGTISNGGGFTNSTETTNHYDAMSNLQNRSITSIDAIGDEQYKYYHYDYDGYNQIRSIETNGEANTKKIRWDINGNLLSDEYGTTRQFDKENHEVAVIKQTRKKAPVQASEPNSQWAMGLRLTQSVDKTTFHYQYSNGQLIDTEVKATGNDTTENGYLSVYATPTIRVISAQDGSIKDIQYSDIGRDNTVYYTTDFAQWATAGQRNAYHYDADGNLVNGKPPNTTALSIFTKTKLFHGDLHDMITGEDYRRVRFVTTHIGGMRQFTSRDFGQKLVNLDGFANENAVLYGDASGHKISTLDWVGIAVGIAVAVAVVCCGIYFVCRREVEALTVTGEIDTATKNLPKNVIDIIEGYADIWDSEVKAPGRGEIWSDESKAQLKEVGSGRFPPRKEGLANLRGAKLSGADLSEANLSWADLRGADLSGADLSRANLSRANLYGANLSGSNLSEANLSGSNLSKSNLSRAKVTRANLDNVTFIGVDINGVNLREVGSKKGVTWFSSST